MPAKGFSIMRGAAEKIRGMWYATERIILLVKRLGVRRVAELSSEDISENISSEYVSYLLRESLSKEGILRGSSLSFTQGRKQFDF